MDKKQGKKMGRPTDNPKPYKFTVTADEESKQILTAYAEQERVTQSEAVRIGIKKLKEDLS